MAGKKLAAAESQSSPPDKSPPPATRHIHGQCSAMPLRDDLTPVNVRPEDQNPAQVIAMRLEIRALRDQLHTANRQNVQLAEEMEELRSKGSTATALAAEFQDLEALRDQLAQSQLERQKWLQERQAETLPPPQPQTPAVDHRGKWLEAEAELVQLRGELSKLKQAPGHSAANAVASVDTNANADGMRMLTLLDANADGVLDADEIACISPMSPAPEDTIEALRQQLRSQEKVLMDEKSKSGRMAVELMQLKASDDEQGSTNAGPTNVAVQLLQERVAAEMKENEGLQQAVRDAKADAVLLRQELVDAEARALQREQDLAEEAHKHAHIDDLRRSAAACAEEIKKQDCEQKIEKQTVEDAEQKIASIRQEMEASLQTQGAQAEELQQQLNKQLLEAAEQAEQHKAKLSKLKAKKAAQAKEAEQALQGAKLLEEEHLDELTCELSTVRQEVISLKQELAQLKPLRMKHLRGLLKSVVEKKLLRKRVRVMAHLLREAKVPWAVDIKTSHNVVVEFAKSERAYCESLTIVVNIFLPAIAKFQEKLDKYPNMGGVYDQMKRVMDILLERHTAFATTLSTAAFEATGKEASLKQVVEDISETIHGTYGIYLIHLQKFIRNVEKLQQEDKTFAAEIKSAIRKNKKKGRGLGMQSFLFQPVQRMAGYGSLCERLAKVTSSEHIMYKERIDSLVVLQAASFHCDALVGSFNAVEKLMLKFANSESPEAQRLLFYGQRIWKDGELFRVVGDEMAVQHVCMLLQDTFVFVQGDVKAKELGDATICLLSGAECKINETNPDTLELTAPDGTQQLFRATSSEECEDWVRQVNENIGNNQLLSNLHDSKQVDSVLLSPGSPGVDL